MEKARRGLLIAVLLLPIHLLQGQTTTTNQELTDRYITAAVGNRLTEEKSVSSDDVDVTTHLGIVTLSGSVDNLPVRDRFINIAESTRFVLGVVDRLAVLPVARSDQSIRNDVVSALRQDPATDTLQVAATVRDSVVSLTGTVGSYAEKRLAGRVAEGVKGIDEVRNNIAIRYPTAPTDREIAADINARLQWDVWLNGGRILASVKDGAVSLSGETGSAVAKSRAFRDVWVNGVSAVDYVGLRVNPTAYYPDQRTFASTLVADGEIRNAVLASFRSDPRISPYSPEVQVENGEVTLSGEVENLKARTAAEEDVRDIVGVWRVGNYIKVRPKNQFTDSGILRELQSALGRDPLLEGARIEASVINHAAYLSGEVESGMQRAEANDAASRTRGLSVIRNFIKVVPTSTVYLYDWPYYDFDDDDYNYYSQPPFRMTAKYGPSPYPSDSEIKTRIEKTLTWSPYILSGDIQVTVSGGVATLTGSVNTWIGWGEAYKAARQNAAAVVNQIAVRRHPWS